MLFSKFNTQLLMGIALTLLTPLSGWAYSSVSQINAFLAQNECRIRAMSVADNSEKYERNLNQEIESENDSFLAKNTRVEFARGHQSHIFIPAPSREVGVPSHELGVDEEFYIYFNLNKKNPRVGGPLIADLFIYTSDTFTEVPAKLQNFPMNESISLKFKTQKNRDRYYFFQCTPKS